jgi:hypothetical protein
MTIKKISKSGILVEPWNTGQIKPKENKKENEKCKKKK